jgi:hypothetical protein
MADLMKQLETAEKQLEIAEAELARAQPLLTKAENLHNIIYAAHVQELDMLVNISKEKQDKAFLEKEENAGWTETDRQNAALKRA